MQSESPPNKLIALFASLLTAWVDELTVFRSCFSSSSVFPLRFTYLVLSCDLLRDCNLVRESAAVLSSVLVFCSEALDAKLLSDPLRRIQCWHRCDFTPVPTDNWHARCRIMLSCLSADERLLMSKHANGWSGFPKQGLFLLVYHLTHQVYDRILLQTIDFHSPLLTGKQWSLKFKSIYYRVLLESHQNRVKVGTWLSVYLFLMTSKFCQIKAKSNHVKVLKPFCFSLKFGIAFFASYIVISYSPHKDIISDC